MSKQEAGEAAGSPTRREVGLVGVENLKIRHGGLLTSQLGRTLREWWSLLICGSPFPVCSSVLTSFYSDVRELGIWNPEARSILLIALFFLAWLQQELS